MVREMLRLRLRETFLRQALPAPPSLQLSKGTEAPRSWTRQLCQEEEEDMEAPTMCSVVLS